MLWAGSAGAVLPATQLVITSLSIAGNNLVFDATFPPNVERAVLELRPVLTAAWEQAALLEIPAAGGTIEFTMPKPGLESAFFRLNATFRATTNAQLSAELQYVTMPPLGPATTNAGSSAEAVFHFKGLIDGSDRISITHEGALWEHVNWGWPAGVVTVNGTQWNPSEKNYLTTTGAVAFLPDTYALASASLEISEGRDVITLEVTNRALMVYLDDTQPGAAPYEFTLHFHPVAAKRAATRQSTVATLKIAAQIDGSDRLKITADGATWTHQAYAYP